MNRERILDEVLSSKEYKEFVASIENRKIITFGATSIAERMMEFIPYEVSYYIDNDSGKWGNQLNGIPIYAPDKLLSETEDIAIIVTNNFFKEVFMQIKNLGILNYTIINGDKIFGRFKSIIKFEEYNSKFENFILNMPKLKDFHNIAILQDQGNDPKDKIIGVVVYSYTFTNLPWYLMTLASLLKYAGYEVVIIWDDISKHSDVLLEWEGSTEYQNNIIKSGLRLISEKLDIKILKLSTVERQHLDEADLIEIDRLAELNTRWKYRVISSDNNLLGFKSEYVKILSESLRSIKSIPNLMKFKRIIVLAGLYDNMGLYTFVGQRKGIDIGSLDFGARNIAVFSTNYPCGQFMDIKRIIDEGLFTEIEQSKLSSLGRKMFEENMYIKGERINGVWQNIGYTEDDFQGKYDIIIPLNIGWDAAAIGKNSFFRSIEDWLMQTIEYILQHTNATVAVRQHPAEKNVNRVNESFERCSTVTKTHESGEDLYLNLIDKFGFNERFRYIKSAEKINTYKLIENARIVLPYTSTLGLEAIMMRKSVIIEGAVYYGGISPVEQSSSKEDYFNKIQGCLLCEEKVLDRYDLKEIEIAYFLVKLGKIKTQFVRNSSEWMDRSISELLEDETIRYTLKVFGEGIPLAFLQAKSILKTFND